MSDTLRWPQTENHTFSAMHMFLPRSSDFLKQTLPMAMEVMHQVRTLTDAEHSSTWLRHTNLYDPSEDKHRDSSLNMADGTVYITI